MANKKYKTMAEVTAGYEDFIKKRKAKEKKFDEFEKAIKKAVTTKQRGSK